MYENAPATKMLATHCACCGRPLVDSVSVETGVGPECRKKHGLCDAQSAPDWTAAIDELALADEPGIIDAREWGNDAQACANRLVHRIAALQDGANVNAMTTAVKHLGFVRLADRIAARLAAVSIELDRDCFVVRGPYSVEAVDLLRRVPGRRWDREAKANRFPVEARRELFVALARAYPGATATGPKGLFILPTAA